MPAYRTLFTGRIEHNYYTSDVSNDFTVVPTPSTAKYMRERRLIFRSTGNIFRVAGPITDAGDPIIPLETQFNFKFGLQLHNNRLRTLVNVTKLETNAVDYVAGTQPFFHNQPLANNELKYVLLDGLYPTQFVYNVPTDGIDPAPASVELTVRKGNTNIDVVFDMDGNPVPTPYIVARDENGNYPIRLDFSKEEAQLYTFRLSNPGGGNIRNRKIFIDNELKAQNPFAVCEIKHRPAVPFTDDEVIVGFNRRNTKWRYIIVEQSQPNNSTTDFEIINNGPGNFNFARDITREDELKTTIDSNLQVFISNRNIPFRELTRLDFNLFKGTGNNQELLIRHLPNPSLQGISTAEADISEIFVYV